LEIEVSKMLGEEWLYVGKGDLVIGALIPDFVHKQRKEVLGCYFHACPRHFPNVRIERNAKPEYRDGLREEQLQSDLLWEHTVKEERRKLAFAESGVKDPSVYADA